MAFPTGWGRKHAITIDNTQVAGTGSHTDFPVKITLDHLDAEVVDAGVNSALNGGGDIRFSSDADGNTQLACEIVEFITNATAGTRRCKIYVKVPSLSTSTDTTIYIWYKKAGETQPATTDTYGRDAVWTGYHGVWHFNDDGVDSSGNQPNMTIVGSPASVDGGGYVFDDTGDYLKVQMSSGPTDLTWETSAKHNGGSWERIFTLSDISTGDYWLVQKTGADNLNFDTNNQFGSGGPVGSTAIVNVANHFAGRFPSPKANVADIFGNGQYETTAGNGGGDVTGGDLLHIGIDDNESTFTWNGEIYYLRFYDGIRSDEWLETAYNSEGDAANFASAGTPEDATNEYLNPQDGFNGGSGLSATHSSYVVPAGDNKKLIVVSAAYNYGDFTNTSSTATFDGNSMTLVASVADGVSGGQVTDVFEYNLGSTTPTGDVVVTSADTSFCALDFHVFTITEVKQQAAEATETHEETVATITDSITTITDDAVILSFGQEQGSGSLDGTYESSGSNIIIGDSVISSRYHNQGAIGTFTGSFISDPVGSGYKMMLMVAYESALGAVAPTIEQADYRFYADGTESGSTALAAQNTAASVDAETTFQLRTLGQSTGDRPAETAKLRYRKSGGTYGDV